MKRIKIIIKKIIPRQYHSKISYLYNYLQSLFLFGFKYKYIFCKGHFRRLLSAGLKNDIAINLIGGVSLCFMSSMPFIISREISLLVFS